MIPPFLWRCAGLRGGQQFYGISISRFPALNREAASTRLSWGNSKVGKRHDASLTVSGKAVWILLLWSWMTAVLYELHG